MAMCNQNCNQGRNCSCAADGDNYDYWQDALQDFLFVAAGTWCGFAWGMFFLSYFGK